MRHVSDNKRIRRSLLYTVLLLALLGTGIYAWIYGDSAPTVNASMRIGDTSGLVFVLADGNTDLINLNEHLGLSTDNMVLNEVSSADGVSFLRRDTSQFYPESGNPDGNGEILSFKVASENKLEKDVKTQELKFTGDYVHTQLNLSLEYAEPGATYYIYFLNGQLGTVVGYETGFSPKEGSHITENGLKALRASIAVSGAKAYGPALSGTGNRMIFGNAGETIADGRTRAITKTETKKLKLPGSSADYSADIAGSYYIDYLGGTPGQYGTLTAGMDVQSFASCAVDGKDGLSGETVPNPNYLFVLDSTCKSVQMTLNLWLEGGSNYCENSQISIKDNVLFEMFLVAYKVSPAEST